MFCVPPQTNGAASAMYTFLASCRRQKRSVTDARGSSPMRAVPISWIDQPGGSGSRLILMSSACAAISISSIESAMSLAIFSSLSRNM